jgi:hypothetical protein
MWHGKVTAHQILHRVATTAQGHMVALGNSDPISGIVDYLLAEVSKAQDRMSTTRR